jgi:hypothetical protein
MLVCDDLNQILVAQAVSARALPFESFGDFVEGSDVDVLWIGSQKLDRDVPVGVQVFGAPNNSNSSITDPS